jgi:hypothetical protein
MDEPPSGFYQVTLGKRAKKGLEPAPQEAFSFPWGKSESGSVPATVAKGELINPRPTAESGHGLGLPAIGGVESPHCGMRVRPATRSVRSSPDPGMPLDLLCDIKDMLDARMLVFVCLMDPDLRSYTYLAVTTRRSHGRYGLKRMGPRISLY